MRACAYENQSKTFHLMTKVMQTQIRLDDISSHAFWLSNSLALLYFLRRDPHTAENTLEYQGNLHDLIRGCKSAYH